MKLSILGKSIFAKLLFYSGAVDRKIDNLGKSGQFLILTYHRIRLPDKAIQAGMIVTPDTFNQHLLFLKDRFTVISLKALITACKNGVTISPEKPACVLTFDDGWRDFYENAFPLLCKYKLPATVFLPTEYIGSQKRFWTDRVADIILQQQKTPLDFNVKAEYSEIVSQFQNLQGNLENKLEIGINLLKSFSKVQIDEILSIMSQACGLNETEGERDFIDWSEVDEMQKSGLVSFGSHTVSHEILTTVTEREVQQELIDSKNKLLERGCMDSSCISFCYPNGNFNDDIAKMVRDAGYHIAVTTTRGWNQKDADMMCLNRVGLHQDMTSNVPLFAARIAGFI